MSTEIVTAIPTDLANAVAETGLAPDGAATLAAGYAPHFTAFNDARDRASAITDAQPAAARAMRLELRRIRTDADKTRKALKEDALRRGKAIDGVNHVLRYQLIPVEEAMEAIEKAEQRREEARVQELLNLRRAELEPFCDPAHYDLGNMPEPAYVQLLAGAKASKAAALAAEKKAEAERIKAEKAAKKKAVADEAERVRLRAENERLAAEAEKERKAAAAREQKIRDDARRVQDIADAKAEKARAEADRLAQEKAEAERVAAEEAAAVKRAAQKAASAPDRERMAAFAAAVRALPVPVLTSEKGAALTAKMTEAVAAFAARVDDAAAQL